MLIPKDYVHIVITDADGGSIEMAIPSPSKEYVFNKLMEVDTTQPRRSAEFKIQGELNV